MLLCVFTVLPWCVKRFNKWRMEGQKLEEILKKQLDGILQFFTEIYKNDETSYELDSLRTMMAVLDRHL